MNRHPVVDHSGCLFCLCLLHVVGLRARGKSHLSAAGLYSVIQNSFTWVGGVMRLTWAEKLLSQLTAQCTHSLALTGERGGGRVAKRRCCCKGFTKHWAHFGIDLEVVQFQLVQEICEVLSRRSHSNMWNFQSVLFRPLCCLFLKNVLNTFCFCGTHSSCDAWLMMRQKKLSAIFKWHEV